MALPNSSELDIFFLRDSRNHLVFLHHATEGDFYGFQFECNWDYEICYLFCEIPVSFLVQRYEGIDHHKLLEQNKEALAERAVEKHIHGDSRLHQCKKSSKLRRYDVRIDADDWLGLEISEV